jgi:NTE family protein
MTNQQELRSDKPADSRPGTPPSQVVLVLQGGGALGCYQAGVYQVLHEVGIEPNWIIGTSIGAINASLIAGSSIQDRMTRLKEFWKRIERNALWETRYVFPALRDRLSLWSTFAWGVPGFFDPNPLAQFGDMYRLGSERAGYYSIAPLQGTLQDLVNFDHINRDGPRLTVGAAHVQSSRMRYFDSRECPINLKHVLASAALPPAFPPVRIDGELYWDGGILSNSPSEVVFDDNPCKPLESDGGRAEYDDRRLHASQRHPILRSH